SKKGLENIWKASLKHNVNPNDIEADEEDDEFGRADTSKFSRTLLTNICNGANPKGQNNRETLDSIMKLYFKKFPDRVWAGYSKGTATISVALFQSIGSATAVQYKRYFQEMSAGNNSSLPLAPVRNGFIPLTEREILRMLWNDATTKKCPKKGSKSGYQRQTTTITADDMKEHLNELYQELSENQSELSEN
ncbi:hypothetical protein BGX26_007872, partial [Mortierella sp. AD094]